MRLARLVHLGSRSHVGRDDGHACAQPLVPGMRSALHRLGAGVVVDEDGREVMRGGDPHAVEMRQRAVPMPEQAEHRQHAIDGADERLRGLKAAARLDLPKRQEIEQEIHEHARVAAGMAAVREDLTIELADEVSGRPTEKTAEALAAQARIAERDGSNEPSVGRRSGMHVAVEVADHAPKSAHQAAIELSIGTVEEERGLGKESEKTTSGDWSLPGNPGRVAPLGDVFRD
jgi:hypothetical protein